MQTNNVVLWTENNGQLLTYYIQKEVNIKELADVLLEVAPSEDKHIIYHQEKDGYLFDMGNGNTAWISGFDVFKEKYPTANTDLVNVKVRRVYV